MEVKPQSINFDQAINSNQTNPVLRFSKIGNNLQELAVINVSDFQQENKCER